MTLTEEQKDKLKKIAKGAALAFLGAGLVSLAQYLSQSDFGVWTPWLQAGASMLLNIAKVLKNL